MTDPAWLDRKALMQRYSLPRRAVGRLQRLGKLPMPSYHLGPHSPRWRTEEVEELFLGRCRPGKPGAREITAEIVQDILKAKTKRAPGRAPSAVCPSSRRQG